MKPSPVCYSHTHMLHCPRLRKKQVELPRSTVHACVCLNMALKEHNGDAGSSTRSREDERGEHKKRPRSPTPAGSPKGFVYCTFNIPFGSTVKPIVRSSYAPKECFKLEHRDSCVSHRWDRDDHKAVADRSPRLERMQLKSARLSTLGRKVSQSDEK